MTENYSTLKRLYERHRPIVKRRPRSVEQKAIAEMVEAIGSMVRECEAVFDGIAEAYQSLEKTI